MQTGTIFSGIGHAGLILWVLVGDWLFPASPPQEIVATQVSLITSEEFAALQAATPTPAAEPAPTRPAPRPDPVVEPEPVPEPVPAPAPEPVPEPVPEPEPVAEPTPPPPSDAVQAAEEQALESPSTEINPTPEAAEIVAPSPIEVETEAETSDNPTPAVSEQPSETVVEQDTQTEETVAEDAGDVLQTEANREQTDATGMTTSIRPRTRPTEQPEPEPELAAAAPEPQPQPVDDAATDNAIAALLEEVAAPSAETPAETPAETGGQDLPQGPPLTGGEMGDISSSIARKWNLGAASTDTLSTMIVIRVSFAADGKPTNFELLESDGPTQTGIDKLYESARRAVNRAYADGGLPLPADKYDTWRVLDLVFDANGMRLR